MSNKSKEVQKVGFRAVLYFIAYIALVCIGISLILKTTAVGAAFTLIANIIAYSMTAVFAFMFAKSKRNIIFIILWIAAVALIVVSYIIK